MEPCGTRLICGTRNLLLHTGRPLFIAGSVAGRFTHRHLGQQLQAGCSSSSSSTRGGQHLARSVVAMSHPQAGAGGGGGSSAADPPEDGGDAQQQQQQQQAGGDGDATAAAAGPSSYSYAEKGLGQRLGQNFNSAGVSLFLKMWWGERSLAVPHLDVTDIRWVDWGALKAAGFKGCVFDKDNTLTEPYASEVAPILRQSLEECRAAFGGRMVLYSNSAGLYQFDPDGKEAEEVEAALGVPVLRHAEKKPAGGAADMERHFGCEAHELVMVGDRYFTDVVFGNRNGLLTIRPAPLTLNGEPRAVQLVRGFEKRTVDWWRRGGAEPPAHPLVPGGAAALAGFVRAPEGVVEQEPEEDDWGA